MVTEIEFRRTSNIFINTGIVAFYQYLKTIKEEKYVDYNFDFSLEKDSLRLKCEFLFRLFEDAYYLMGRELYDTSGAKARQESNKFYFTEEPFQFTAFFKMKTYGLGALITNDPQPVPKDERNAITFTDLVRNKPEFAREIGQVYFDKKMKLKDFEPTDMGFQISKNSKGDSRIYLNEPYIKITRLEKPTMEYFRSGSQVCYLTNESFEKLVESQNTSPFIKGLDNFNSFLVPRSLRISWKAMFISRFSPKLCFYSYVKDYDSIVCYLFDSNNLVNLNLLYEQNRSMYKDSVQLIQSNYRSNFKTYSFSSGHERLAESKDYTGENENLFALLYTFYNQFLHSAGLENTSDDQDLFDLGFDKIPVTLISFKANSFSATIRPNSFEYFNNYRYVIRLIVYLEREGVRFSHVLESLKFLRNSDRNSVNRDLLERKLRENVLKLILNRKSVIGEISKLYYQCYIYLLKGDSVGIKNYEQLFLVTSKYELKINRQMTPEMQEKAFNLGKSIGLAIINFENPESEDEKRTNVKIGRKYIIDLHKSRTFDQFNDAIIRIMNKYQLVINADLFREHLSEDNFKLIKQFAIIGGLNVINLVIKPINTIKNEEQ